MQAIDKFLVRFLEGSDIEFIVPVFQRRYNWQIEHCKRLWDDIKSIIETKQSHFLGSIVSVVNPTPKLTEYMIIDGQQRLTTLSLLIAAISNLIVEGELSDPAYLLKGIQNKYLLDEYRRDHDKLKLRLVSEDQPIYRKIVVHDDLEGIQSNLINNYDFFRNEVIRYKDDCSVESIIEAIKKIVIVDIQLKPGHDDPQLIFESLNSTGLALSEADKIRNFVLMNLSSNIQDNYYRSYWKKIEQNVASAKNGVSDFVRDWLTFKLRQIPRADRVYFQFKNYVLQEQNEIVQILKDLLKYSGYYKVLLTGETSNKALASALKNLLYFENRILFPYLLELLDHQSHDLVSEADLIEILKMLESFLFRRNICGVPTNTLNKMFTTFEKDIERYDAYKGQYLDVFKYVILDKTSSLRFPRDEEFEQALITRDIYNMQARTKVYLLENLENSFSKEVLNVRELLDEGVLTIEHIMPQTLTRTWEQELKGDYQDIHMRLLHTLGNLTLTAYNIEYRNFPFLQKRDMENGFRNSKLRINDFVSLCETWSECQINERAKLLAKVAVNRWPVKTTQYTPPRSDMNTFSMDDELTYRSKSIVSFEFNGKEFKVSNWSDFFKQVVQMLYEQDGSILQKIVDEPAFAVELASIFSNDEKKLRSATTISDHIFVEMNTSIDRKLQIIRLLLDYYDETDTNLRFTIKKKEYTEHDSLYEDLAVENEGRGLNKADWVELLNQPEIFNLSNLQMIWALYHHNDHKSVAGTISQELKTSVGNLNIQLTFLGKRIVKAKGISDQLRLDGSMIFWNILLTIEYGDNNAVIWRLRPELIEAIDEIGLAQVEKMISSASSRPKTHDHTFTEFWTQFMAELRLKSDDFNREKPGKEHWMNFGAGVSAVEYSVSATGKNATVSMVFIRSDKNENKKLFDLVAKHKSEIEQQFGKPLTWQRLDEKISSRIEIQLPGANIYDSEQWPKIRSFLLENLIKLNQAIHLKDYLREST